MAAPTVDFAATAGVITDVTMEAAINTALATLDGRIDDRLLSSAVSTVAGVVVAATTYGGMRSALGLGTLANMSVVNHEVMGENSVLRAALGNAAVGTAEIADSNVTNAKLAAVATATLKGRAATGTGAVTDLSVADVRTMLNIGDIDETTLALMRKVSVDHLTHRPGDAPEHFSLSPATMAVNADGAVARTADSQAITAGPFTAIEGGERYAARFAYSRASGSSDPAGDAIVCGVRWYNNAKQAISSQTLDTNLGVTVSAGRQRVESIISRSAESGINFIAPLAARYAKAYVYTYGTDHTTDVEVCEIARLPSNLLPGPQGVKGDRGWQGFTGIRGPRGFQGAVGPSGTTLQFALTDGASDDIADRPATADDGDTWGLTGSGQITIYVWANSQWNSAGTITSASSANIANTIFVQENGNDALGGLSPGSAVATIERALAIAATFDGDLTLIDLLGANDNAVTEGRLDMPDNTIIRCAHRTWVFKPATGFEERNVFRLGSGCFLEGVLAEGFRVDDLDDPTEGFLASFRPGAVIRRVPYIHKCAVRTPPSWGLVPPPLSRSTGNPAVGRGGGVILADGAVCSQYSTFANIMAWGATPVSPNGIGYCAKRGGLINAINAISLWAHRHFYALTGGQIILSACSTQFGDFTLHSDGYRDIIIPGASGATLTAQTAADTAIEAASATIIDNMWDALVDGSYTTTWNTEDETYTRSDAALFLQCIRWVLQYADETPMINFARSLFNTVGAPVFSSDKLAAFQFSFSNMGAQINALAGVNNASDAIVSALVTALNDTLETPVKRREPSKITAIGHTWSGILAGVALTKIPPAENAGLIQDSILETNEGVVVASGQDDQGNALFVGGLTINANTGELGGPPFETAVRRIATRAAISRSF